MQPTADGDISLSELMPFDDNREIKVAKGTSVLLKVKADADQRNPRILFRLLPDRGR